MEGWTLYLDRSSLNFFLSPSSLTFCCALKSGVIIQPLCHEFFIVAAFLPKRKMEHGCLPCVLSSICPPPPPPPHSPLFHLPLFLKHSYYLSCGYYLPLRRRCPPVAICNPSASAESRERERRGGGGRPSSDVQGNDREGGVGED